MKETKLNLLLEEIAGEIKAAEKRNREMYESAIDIDDEELSLKIQKESFTALRKMRGLKDAMNAFKHALEDSGILNGDDKNNIFVGHEHNTINIAAPAPVIAAPAAVAIDEYADNKTKAAVIESAVETAIEEAAVEEEIAEELEAELEEAESVAPSVSDLIGSLGNDIQEINTPPAYAPLTPDVPEPAAMSEFVLTPETPETPETPGTPETSEMERKWQSQLQEQLDSQAQLREQVQESYNNDVFGGDANADDTDDFADIQIVKDNVESEDTFSANGEFSEFVAEEPDASDTNDFAAFAALPPLPPTPPTPPTPPPPPPVEEIKFEPFNSAYTDDDDDGDNEEILASLTGNIAPAAPHAFAKVEFAPIAELQEIEEIDAKESAMKDELEMDALTAAIAELESNEKPAYTLPPPVPAPPVSVPPVELPPVPPPPPVELPPPAPIAFEPIAPIVPPTPPTPPAPPAPPKPPAPPPVAVEPEYDFSGFAPSAPGIYNSRTLDGFTMFGRRVDVNNWAEMLVRVCEILILKNPYTVAQFDKYDDLNPLGNVYFSYSQGKISGQARKLSNGLWIELNRTPDDIVMLCKKVLELCGYPRNELEIEFAD
ncbi:MAG: hypothetical protein FWG45_01180 [Oscillospiraceae bacterium]|nr:hypothetical protein [Oscillospiraceae bacterium]